MGESGEFGTPGNQTAISEGCKTTCDALWACKKKRIVGKQGNRPAVYPIATVTGDKKLPFQYTAGKTRVYNRPTEKEIREQRDKTAALVANDGLVPSQGGGTPLVNELSQMRKMPIPTRKRIVGKQRVQVVR